MWKSVERLINKTKTIGKILGAAIAFGGLALLVNLGNFKTVIPGTSMVTDPREIFTLLGSSLTGPIGGIVVGWLAGADWSGPWEASTLAHAASGFIVGLMYRWFVFPCKTLGRTLLAWIGLVIFYYYVLLIPMAIVGVRWFYGDVVAYRDLMSGTVAEIILTVLVTVLVLFALPYRYRVPIGCEGCASAKERNIPLVLRMSLWFLLVFFLLLFLIAIFIHNYIPEVQEQRVVLLQFGVALLIVLIITAVAIWLLVGRPVRKLIKAARQIGEGHLSTTIESAAMEGEFEELAVAFNHMTERLQEMVGSLEERLSELKLAEEKARQSEVRYRLMFERNPLALYRSTLQGEVIEVNPAMVRLFGYPDVELLLAMNTTDMYVNPQSQSTFRALLKKNGVVRDLDAQFRRYDQVEIWVRENARIFTDPIDGVEYIEGSIQDITHRRQMDMALRQERDLAEALATAANVIATSLDFDEVLDRILEQVNIVFHGNDGISVKLVKGRTAYNVRWLGYKRRFDDAVIENLVFDIDTIENYRYMVETGQPLIVADTTNEPGWVVIPGLEWLLSQVTAPIFVREEIVGFLSVDSSMTHFFTQSHAAALGRFACQAAVAIENARLYEASQQELAERKRTEAILREERDMAAALEGAASALTATLEYEEVLDRILEQVADVVPGAMVLIGLLQGEMMINARWWGHDNLTDPEFLRQIEFSIRDAPNLIEVIETREPYFIPDTKDYDDWLGIPELSWIRSHITAPIVVRDEVVGFLNLDSPTPNFFSVEHGNIVKAFSRHAAAALENARLYETALEEIEQRKKVEEALRQAHDELEIKVKERTLELLEINKTLEEEIVERKRAEEMLSIQATTDPLTGLLNRRRFFELAGQELERSKRYQNPFSIILFDIDYFKQVNDKYGHLAGDLVLQKLADHCKELMRKVDQVGRYGGEEFVVLLPETDVETAQQAAERLRREIMAQLILTDAGDICITISLGVASLDGDFDLVIDQLLDRADHALYHSKNTGRNRVTVWHSGMEEKE